MLATLLAWLYISFLCWSWGNLTFKALTKTANENFVAPDFSFVCFTGLVIVTTITAVLSIFFPIGSLSIQLVILLPALINFIFRKSYADIKNEIITIKELALIAKLLLAVCLLMTLVISCSFITNQDTIGYHAQTIEWIEKYKAIPGLVHLHRRYGYQGLWYVASAFFNFSFIKSNLSTFTNTSVLLWFFIFIIKKINFYTSSTVIADKKYFFFWILLLIISLLSFNQVRGTATSSSPDFIATIFSWCVFYIFLNLKTFASNVIRLFLIILFSLFALAIKLSVLPVALFALAAFIGFIRFKRIKVLFLTIGISFLLIASFITRNIITSGYIVFPSTTVDIIDADWKYNKDLTQLEKKYITAYARTHVSYTKEKVEAVMNMNLSDWMPVWWKTINFSDKVILLSVLVSTILLLLNLKKIYRQKRDLLIAAIISITGISFWFIQAPDSRFGFGFLIPLIAFGLLSVRNIGYLGNFFSKKIFAHSLMIVACISIIVYIGYWLKTNETKEIALLPDGLKQIPYKTIQINGNAFTIPENQLPCSGTPLPCVYDSCRTYNLRGNKITDGFKTKEGYHPNSWKL